MSGDKSGFLNSPPLDFVQFTVRDPDGSLIKTLSMPEAKFNIPTRKEGDQESPEETIRPKLVEGYLMTFVDDGLGEEGSVELISVHDLRTGSGKPVPLDEVLVYCKPSNESRSKI